MEHTTTTPQRKTAFAAGVIYLITFISIPTLSLYVPIHQPGYVLTSGPDNGIITGTILELIVALGGIASAVVLYPVLKKHSEIGALGLVSSRILEATTIFAGVAFLLTAVTLKQSGVGHEALGTTHALVTMYDRIFLIGQSFMPAIDDLLLGFMFYKSGLIPKPLSIIGLAGAPLLLASDVAVLFDFVGQRDPLAMMFAIPVAVFEFSLGVWLIVRGFTPSRGSMREDQSVSVPA